MRNSILYGGLIIIECLFWGIGNPVTKIALETLPPFYMLGIRFTFAFLLMILLFGRRIRKEFKQEQLRNSIIIGLFTAPAFILPTLALLYTTATITGFLVSLTVVFTPILAFFIFKDRADKKLIPIIFLVVLGMYLLCGNTGTFTFGLGEALCIFTAIAGAAMLIYSGRHVRDIGPFALSTIQMAVCTVSCFLFALILEDFNSLAHASFEGWMSVIFLTVGCTCIAYSIQNTALRKVSATFVSLAFCSEPIFTAFASYYILGETLSLKGFMGCVLIIAGLVPAALLETDTDHLKAEGKKNVKGDNTSNH